MTLSHFTPVDREQLFRELADIKNVVEGTNTRLDQLNGRTRTLENRMAVHWILWIILGAVLTILVPVMFR